MFIPDRTWDDLNSFCCDLVEQLEAMPQDIFFACRKEAIQLCYTILNMQDKPLKAQRLDKQYDHPAEAYEEFVNAYQCIRLEKLMAAFMEFTYQKDIADWYNVKEKIKFEIDLKKYLTNSIRASKKILK